jgi:hypothetical protein
VVPGESIAAMAKLLLALLVRCQEFLSSKVSRLEEFWNNNLILACVLILMGMGAALYAARIPQSPGFNIGLLACTAGVMSLRPQMHFPENVMWVIVLVSFTYLEVRSINQSDQENMNKLIVQNQQFKETHDALFSLYFNSVQEFYQTMSEFSQTNSREEKRFNALVGQDERLFAHEQQLAESLNGTLLPSNEPMPSVSCGVVPPRGALLLLGDGAQANALIINSFPHTVVGIMRSGSPIIPVMSLDRSPNGALSVLLDVRSRDGKIIVRLNRDGFVVNRNNYLEMKRDRSHLLVIDEYGSEVLRVQYRNPKVISVSGGILGSIPNATGNCSSAVGDADFTMQQ